MGGRDLVEMKCADPSDAPATCHNTQHTQFGIPPTPCMSATLRLVIAHVWARNCQPKHLGVFKPAVLRLAWGLGDSSLWSAKSVAIHCDALIPGSFVVVVSHIRCTTPFAERTNNQVLLPLLLLAAALFFFFFFSAL